MFASRFQRSLAVSGIAALILAGPLGPVSTNASPVHSGATISVVYSASYVFDDDSQSVAFWNGIKKEFEKKYPGNKLNLVPEPGLDIDEMNKLNLMLRLPQTTPDVLAIPTYPVGALVDAGYLEPLNRYVSKWAPWKAFPQSVRSENTIGGKVYGVNFGNNDFGLLYSMPILRKAGVKVPWHPHTWADILTALRKVQALKLPGTYGMFVRLGSANGYSTALKGMADLVVGSRQPTIYDTKTGKWVVRSKGLLDSFQFVHTMVSQGLSGPGSELTMLKPTGTLVWTWLPKQRYAMTIGGNWYPGMWKPNMGGTPWPQAPKVYGITGLPTEFGQKPGITTAIGGWAYAMTKASKNKDLAWKLIELLEQSNHSITVANESGLIPPSQKDFNAKVFVNFAKPYNAAYNDFIKTGRPIPNVSGILKWEQAINDASGQLATNTSFTAKQAQDAFAKEATDLLGSKHVETLK